MTDKAKDARNAYRRKWAKNNPDKLREYQARYWEKKAAEQEAAQEAQEAKETQADKNKE